MIEIKISNKQKYLKENYPFNDPPKMTDMKKCIHCNEIFSVGDYKVFKNGKGEEFICCPHATECDGTVIDWFDL